MRVDLAVGSRRPLGGGERRDKALPSSPSPVFTAARCCSVITARVSGGCWLIRPIKSRRAAHWAHEPIPVTSAAVPSPLARTGQHQTACSLGSEALATQCPRSSPPSSGAPAGTAMASRLEPLAKVRLVHWQSKLAVTAERDSGGLSQHGGHRCAGNPRRRSRLGQAPQVTVSRKLSQRLPAAGGQIRGPSGGAVLALPTAQRRSWAMLAPRVALHLRRRAG